MTAWDITNNRNIDEVKAEADRAYSAIRVVTGRKTGYLHSESEVVEAVRTATDSSTAQFVEDNIVTLRVLFKNWLTQR